MKKWLAVIVAGAIFGYLVLWGGRQFFAEKPDPRSLDGLSKIAAELNRSVPALIDKETELMRVEAHEGMLIYKYRLVPFSVSQLNHEKFAASARERIVQLACNQTETREEYLKNGVTLRYSYFDKNKDHIATVDVAPKDCGF